MKNKDAYLLSGAVALTDAAVKGFFEKPPVKNYGFAGNKLDKHPSVVAFVSAALTGVMVVAVACAPKRMKLPMALILGGALSNSADRLIRGYVVDYIPMDLLKNCFDDLAPNKSRNHSDPAKRYYCNISDLAIFIGAGLGAVGYMLDDSGAADRAASSEELISG